MENGELGERDMRCVGVSLREVCIVRMVVMIDQVLRTGAIFTDWKPR